MLSLRHHRQYLVLSVLCLSFILCISYVSRHDRILYATLSYAGVQTLERTTNSQFPPSPEACSGDSFTNNKTLICANFPKQKLSEVQIVIKIGAAEKPRTESLLNTIGSCIHNAIIVSDAEDFIAGHAVVDILADLLPAYAIDNPDWQAYENQKQKLANGEEVTWSKDLWKLDRFKFFPMIERAFLQAPHASWFVFIESDIYYFWDTLFRQLDLLSPSDYHYLGAPSPAADGLSFVYGGGGIVLSHKLVYDLLKGGKQKLSVKYEKLIRDECCGDSALTYAIHRELGVRMESLSPTIPGAELAFLRVEQDTWCAPLVGIHRVTPEIGTRLWKWERCRPYSTLPIMYSTLLDIILPPDNAANLEKLHWDNFSDGVLPDDSPAHTSVSACKQYCEEDESCLQYRYSKDDMCKIATWVSQGRNVNEQSKGVVSGWCPQHLERLGFSKLVEPGSYCRRPRWPTPKTL